MSEKEDFWKKVFKDKRIRMSDETLKEISEYASFSPEPSKKEGH